MPEAGDVTTRLPHTPVPAAIRWSEGMLLQPQHFQQAALRQESLLHYHLGVAAPFHWGVRTLEIDREQLPQGIFAVRRVEAVMPDGLLVTGDDAPGGLRVNVAEVVKARKAESPADDGENAREALTVYLAVPEWRREGPLVAESGARYRPFADDGVDDMESGERGSALGRLRPAPRLELSDARPAGCVSLPLARVFLQGRVVALTRFLPPTLVVAPGTGLWKECQELARLLREKLEYLCSEVRAAAKAGRVDRRVVELWERARGLSAGLPELEVLLGTGVSHPFQVYLALCSMAGHLGAARPGSFPPRFGPYDHDDLRATFQPVLKYNAEALKEVREKHAPYPFEFREGAFRLRVEEAWTKERLLLGVFPRAGTSPREAAAWMENALIGSRSVLSSIRDRRIRGAERRRTEPSGAHEKAAGDGTLAFTVEPDPHFVVPGEELVIVGPGGNGEKFRPHEVVLYAAVRS